MACSCLREEPLEVSEADMAAFAKELAAGVRNARNAPLNKFHSDASSMRRAEALRRRLPALPGPQPQDNVCWQPQTPRTGRQSRARVAFQVLGHDAELGGHFNQR
jgi:hypothetical protein